MHRQVVSVASLIEEARNLAEGLALKYRDTTFEVQMRPSQGDVLFVSDSDHLQTILRNLLGNAFKFADPSRPNSVVLHCEQRPEGLYLEVKDQGIGIPEAFQASIFDQFAQVQSDARRA